METLAALLNFDRLAGTTRRLIMAQFVLGWLNQTVTAVPFNFSQIAQPDFPTAVAGNPFVGGWYADPDTEIYDNEYWVFPTYSDVYEKQTFLDAFSSSDLVNWKKHSNILTINNVKWATKAVWAPAPVKRDGKYFIYFGANDIQEDEDQAGMIGGIGVAVADKPEGPYIDALGKPLIPHYHNGAQPIDQDVFINDDGQAYIYYGGHSHANVAKLNNDMISIGTFDDGTQFKEITPENYIEGSQMIKRNGIYYFMWSEGSWTESDYAVSYAMSNSPLGPFRRRAKILQQDPNVSKGSGHHGVFHLEGMDIWYIVYHRRPLSETNGNHRELAYDRMYFNSDGTIAPIQMLVQDNFADGGMLGWKSFGGNWSVADKRLTLSGSYDGMATLDTNFTDQVIEATVGMSGHAEPKNKAGLVFRANALDDASIRKLLFAGISGDGKVLLETWNGNATKVVGTNSNLAEDAKEHRIKVRAIGGAIDVFVDDMKTPKLSIGSIENIARGKTGVMALGTTATFGDFSVRRPDDA